MNIVLPECIVAIFYTNNYYFKNTIQLSIIIN